MAGAESFSPDFTTARARFRSAALAWGCEIESHPIGARGPDGEELSIEVARAGDLAPRAAVVVSSGLHGVEGFFGSAVQVALLEEQLGGFVMPDGVGLVLVHGLNPYGMAWGRRVDADNVDCNRNFLRDGEAWEGCPPGYDALNRLLNPSGPPPAVDPFLLIAGYKLLRHGMPALRETVAGGQYDHPLGLFFGGSGPSTTHRVLAAHLRRWIGPARRVLHIDLHTGLGVRGDYRLFVDHASGTPAAAGLANIFGADVVEPWSSSHTSYAIRGGLGTWCKSKMGDGYDVLCAEFGTVSPLAVLRALRDENRATHALAPGDPRLARARAALREAFSPRDPSWRNAVVPKGVAIAAAALEAAVTARSAPT
jgi:hypothetical protein